MSIDRYVSLRTKLDNKAQELELRHQKAIACGRGCHACCQPKLTVFPVEAKAIQNFLQEGQKAQELLALQVDDPFHGERCAFLLADGACSIYEVRPLICRSHGLPLQFRDEADEVQRDVCPLNFTDGSLPNLPGDAVLNLDLINALLTLINQEAYGERAAGRIPLTPRDILDAKL